MRSSKPLTIIFFGTRHLTTLNRRMKVKIHTVDIKTMYFIAYHEAVNVRKIAFLSHPRILATQIFPRLYAAGFLQLEGRFYSLTLDGKLYLKKYAQMLQNARMDRISEKNYPTIRKHRGLTG